MLFLRTFNWNILMAAAGNDHGQIMLFDLMKDIS